MATQPISMNIIKQVLIRLSQKESVRKIAAALHISKNTVSRYKALSEADPMSTRDLIALEDTVLNHRFNGGNPAYCDSRMEVFKELLLDRMVHAAIRFELKGDSLRKNH